MGQATWPARRFVIPPSLPLAAETAFRPVDRVQQGHHQRHPAHQDNREEQGSHEAGQGAHGTGVPPGTQILVGTGPEADQRVSHRVSLREYPDGVRYSGRRAKNWLV